MIATLQLYPLVDLLDLLLRLATASSIELLDCRSRLELETIEPL